MRPSRVRQRWNQGKPAFCSTLLFTDPAVSELVSLMGWDCVWLDLEHRAQSVETVNQMIRAVRVGVSDVMARPAKGEYMRMGRLLEAGAHGILYPRCESEAEAREVVRWAKFAPLGERGFDGGNPDSPYGSMKMADYVVKANEETWLAVQIESPAALPHSRAIAEVPGVDLLFFGPGDFSVLSGVPGQFDSPQVRNAVERVAKDALAAGKRFGTLVFNVEMAKRMLDLGAMFLCYGSDLGLIKAGLGGVQDQFRPLGFEFDDRLTGQSAYSAART